MVLIFLVRYLSLSLLFPLSSLLHYTNLSSSFSSRFFLSLKAYEAISRGWPSSGQYKSSLAEEVLIETSEVSWTRLLFAGGAAGIVGWGSTFGMDVVKSRIQASEPFVVNVEGKKVNHPFKSTWSTIRNSYRGEGMKVFTTGLGPTLLRAVPVNMVSLFFFLFLEANRRADLDSFLFYFILCRSVFSFMKLLLKV